VAFSVLIQNYILTVILIIILFSECIKLLGLIRSMTFRYSSLDCFYLLYFTLVKSKLEYASAVWNSYHAHWCQQAWAHLAEVSVLLYRFPPHVPYSYTSVLQKLGLHSLRKRRHHLDALFFVEVYRGLKSRTSFSENVSLRVPTRSVRDFLTFSVCPSNKHCPSARCAYAANAVGKDLDIFAIGAVSLSHTS
jgi:hypothetical protein